MSRAIRYIFHMSSKTAKVIELLMRLKLDQWEEVMKLRVLKRNAAKCKVCGDTIESTYRHDYVTCSCGNLSVDGGLDYLKRSLRDGFETYEELSEYAEVEDEES